MVIKKYNLYIIINYIFFIFLIFFTNNKENIYILVPILTFISILTWFIFSLKRKDGSLNIDIGLFAVSFSFLYSIVPYLGYYLGGLNFGLLSDGRLQALKPTPLEMGYFSINYVVYFFSLSAGYIYFRKNYGIDKFNKIILTAYLRQLLLFLCIIFGLYFSILEFGFGIGFNSGYNGDELSPGPLILEQINGKLDGIYFILYIALLGLCAYYIKNPIIASVLFFYVLFKLINTFVFPGSRGEIISLLLYITIFSKMFHNINLQKVIIIFLLVFVIFILLGILRSDGAVADLLISDELLRTLGSVQNEFQAVFATTLDVTDRIKDVSVPNALLFNDFTPLLPPQQLLPFEKIAAADWYIKLIGLEGTGSGFMWGIITQAQIGFGVSELILRGLITSWFLAKIHNWFISRNEYFFSYVIYSFLCMSTVWIFRDTSGAILWIIVWTIMPTVILFYMFGLNVLVRNIILK